MLKYFYIVLILFFINFSFSQESEDVLKGKIKFIYELSSIDLDQALSETEKLVKKYEDDKFNQATVYLVLVQINGAMDKNEESIKLCKEGLSLAQKYHISLVPRFKLLLVECYTENSMYEEALAVSESLLKKTTTETSIDFIKRTKLNLAVLNKKINRDKVALNILLEVYRDNYLEELVKGNKDLKQKTFLDIADLYNSLGQKDSTEYFLELYKVNSHIEDPEMLKYIELKVRANVLFKEGEYGKALESYSVYLKEYSKFFRTEDLEVNLKKCNTFFKLGQYDSVLTNLKFISSKEDFTKKLSRKSLAQYYKLLSDVYLATDNKELSNSYLQQHYIALDEFNKSRFNTQEGLNEIKTKEIVAESVQKEKKYKNYITYISSILGFLLIAGITFFLVKSNKNNKRFGELMATIKAFEEKKDNVKSTTKVVSIVEDLPRNIEKVEHKEVKILESVAAAEEIVVTEENNVKENADASRNIESSPIKDEKVQELLEKLEKLKGTGFFLKQECSLYNTAKRLKTNTSYLSSVINNTMNTNFNRYVNDIRMDYVILELKNKAKF